MNPIESVTRALGGVLNTPQAEFYLGVGFPGFVGTPPTPREKEYFLRTVKATTDTIQANRQPVRDLCGRLFVQGSPATPDILHLVSKLSRVARVCHQAGHEWPDTLDEQGRKQTLAEWGTAGDYFTGWVYMICEYFPQLVVPSTDTTDRVADPGPAVARGATSTGERTATGLVDRDLLAGCFKGGFKMVDQAASEPAEAATGAGIGKPLYSLQTSHNRQELARIYAALVDAGYIDGSAPDACGDFCRAFDPAADQQGRIAWAWTDKRTGRVCPRHILDFVAQMAGGLDGIAPDMCDRIAPAIFGQAIARHVLSKFRTRWYRWIDSETPARICETHADIAAIVTGV